MVVLYVGYIWYSTPSEEERNAAIAEQERLVEEARKDSLLQVEEEAFQATLRQEEASATSAADTAAMCAFLASDDASFITGESINVSGGEEVH